MDWQRTALAQTLGLRSDLRRDCRKKRLVAESALEALRAWNDANEIENCPREESYKELVPHLGDADALKEIWAQNRNRTHCPFLRKDPNACESLPEGDYANDIKAGMVCPHHVYHHQAHVFENRDSVADTIERLFRLLNSAELGLVSDYTLDPLSVTELLTARGELDRQSEVRRKREYEKSRMEAEANRRKDLPSWN